MYAVFSGANSACSLLGISICYSSYRRATTCQKAPADLLLCQHLPLPSSGIIREGAENVFRSPQQQGWRENQQIRQAELLPIDEISSMIINLCSNTSPPPAGINGPSHECTPFRSHLPMVPSCLHGKRISSRVNKLTLSSLNAEIRSFTATPLHMFGRGPLICEGVHPKRKDKHFHGACT